LAGKDPERVHVRNVDLRLGRQVVSRAQVQ
jgi:hypothetical protein